MTAAQQILAFLLGMGISAFFVLALFAVIAHLDGFLDKRSCKHDWQVHKEMFVKDTDLGTYHKEEEILICRKCGKIKRIKL